MNLTSEMLSFNGPSIRVQYNRIHFGDYYKKLPPFNMLKHWLIYHSRCAHVIDDYDYTKKDVMINNLNQVKDSFIIIDGMIEMIKDNKIPPSVWADYHLNACKIIRRIIRDYYNPNALSIDRTLEFKDGLDKRFPFLYRKYNNCWFKTNEIIEIKEFIVPVNVSKGVTQHIPKRTFKNFLMRFLGNK